MTLRVRDAQLVLEPYFDAVKDEFVTFSPAPGVRLDRLKKTRFAVDDSIHDTPRHYAACRDDGLLVQAAPELAKLSAEKRVLPVLAHELGHAADFAYPGSFWLERQGAPAVWAPISGKGARRELRRWEERSAHEIEIWADAIALLVLGVVIRYDGACLVQSFNHGVARPEWLR